MSDSVTTAHDRIVKVLNLDFNVNTRIRLQNLIRANTPKAGLMASEELLAIPIVKVTLAALTDDEMAQVLTRVITTLKVSAHA